ncbi:MAG: DegT/DnrJ/EryC1/StrS family aminotransferase [Planctomycetota bacterium]|jgi:dTDP-4-amino-4,6-dideoxygalactose transaminase
MTTHAPAAETTGTRREIPFGRPMIGPGERAAVLQVLEGHTLTHGPLVRSFEQAFERFTRGQHAVAVNSCTAGLHLAWLHAAIGPGDEVIVPALTHVATAHAVELCGARCVFVDAEPATGNMDLDQVEQAITERTRGIAVVHFLGRAVDMDRVMAIARRHHLFVVEDCALALGATYRGRHVGLFGDAGAFSFYPVKHITTAEGGVLLTNREDLAREAACQRAFGIDRNIVENRPVPGSYDVVRLGHNYRMSELSAALGVVQMERLPDFLERRRANDAALAEGLSGIEGIATLPAAPDDRCEDACYCRSILLPESLVGRRAAIITALRARGIGTSIYYPRPVPHLAWYRERYGEAAGIADKRFPVAARLSAGSIALPVGPHLGPDDMACVVAALNDVLCGRTPPVQLGWGVTPFSSKG